MNYREIGLKTGLEFHQRLETGKLFCACPSELQEEKPDLVVERKLRPVAGELGELDPAAVKEALSGKNYEYQHFDPASCLVELDEEPPHQVNAEALETAVILSLMLDCSLVDEVHFMRKTVIDGSNTSGFQRTAMIGHSGKVRAGNAEVSILGTFLEEESAGIVSRDKGKTVYKLDRLGIPLIEIATGIMELDPKQVQDIALEIGKLLRVTGRVQRGLGTIRQDVNISVSGGARVEIKGLQDIRMLAKLVELEAERQLKLIELKNTLSSLQKPVLEPVDLTSYFRQTKCRFIKKALDQGQRVIGTRLPGFAGVLGFKLGPGRRFGSEVSDYAKKAGVGGIIHSDENMSKYPIEQEANAVKHALDMKEKDAFMLVVAEKEKAEQALKEAVERIHIAFEKIPEETRRPLPDGSSEYMRPMAGEHRMYPETDVPPVTIRRAWLDELKSRMPADPKKIQDDLMITYGLPEPLAETMVISKNRSLFYKLAKTGASPTVIAITLEQTMKAIRREGHPVDRITPAHLEQLFSGLAKKMFSKEAVPEILKAWSSAPEKTLDQILSATGLSTASEEDVRKDIVILLERNPELLEDNRKAFRVIMGELMKKYRGRIDGSRLSMILRKEIGG